MKGMVIEEFQSSTGGWSLCAFGLSAFAGGNVVDEALSQPEPFLICNLVARQGRQERALLDVEGIAGGNSGAGVDLVAHYWQRDWNFAAPLWRHVGMLAHQMYVRHHGGYRMRRALQEDWQRDTDIYIASGYRLRERFDVEHGGARRQRNLYYCDTQEAANLAPGTSLSFVMHYKAPKCTFTRGEQRVLARAVEGETDDEIAAVLHVSPNTLKQVWRSIYARIDAGAPHVFPKSDGVAEGRRGPERRRLAVSFAVDNPQEFRPHMRPRNRSGAGGGRHT